MLKRVERIKRVLNDYVMVLEAKQDGKTKSGLYIEKKEYKQWQGKGLVVAVGPGRRTIKGKFIKTKAKVGMLVTFNKWHTQKMEINGKPYAFVRDHKILWEIQNDGRKVNKKRNRKKATGKV